MTAIRCFTVIDFVIFSLLGILIKKKKTKLNYKQDMRSSPTALLFFNIRLNGLNPLAV